MAHPSAELYGSDRMFAESVAALAERGWRVVVALPDDGPLVAAVSEYAEVVRCATPVLRKAALRPVGMARLAAEAVRATGPASRLLRRLRPDLVYVNTVTVPQWIALARLHRVPVLTHVHEAEDDVPGPVRAALSAPLLAANAVVVNSEAARRSITRPFPRLARRSRLVYNGVASPTGPAELPEAAPSPVRLVLVGRLSPRKGTDIAVAAVERLCRDGLDVTLDLVGSVFPGYEWYQRQLEEQIRDAGLDGRVRLHGFTADVGRAYACADLALVPSRVEPFGNTAVEAQLAGLPVIVSDAQGLPETVDGGAHGTVVPRDDPAALAGAVREAVACWQATRRRAVEAALLARERFAPERYRHELAGVAAELADR
ncbi:glycosyltransferase family 4 protein [Haloechinothrix sp. LS1_15]|nr:glycosyltransferase family 4 protein [Haloechinothrix sp. LS1_15]